MNDQLKTYLSTLPNKNEVILIPWPEFSSSESSDIFTPKKEEIPRKALELNSEMFLFSFMRPIFISKQIFFLLSL